MAEVTPALYGAWRAKPIGALTELVELEAVLALTGDLTGRQVLDVGTGDGTYALAAAERGAHVIGADLSPKMLEAARQRASERGLAVTWQLADALALPFPERTFDLVFAITVLCFVPDAQKAFVEIARVLKPGGRVVLGELGRFSIWAAWRRIRGWLGSPIWRAAKFRTASELRRLLGQAALTVEAVRGSVYYPPNVRTAQLLAALDQRLGRATTVGAAFLVVAAVRPGTFDAIKEKR